jgi:uracil-DNA glycosylase
MASITSFFKPNKCKKRAAEDESSSAAAAKVVKSSEGVGGAIASKTIETSSDWSKCVVETDIWAPFDEAMNDTWRDRLMSQTKKAYFKSLSKFVSNEIGSRPIYPPTNKIFAAFSLCAFEDIKVVILGQDPYHGPGQAHGLAFSVEKGVPFPPSLNNIIKEAISDVKITRPKHGNLESWSKQGVFLLNTCLTVRRGEANSHQKKGWEEFTDAAIREISKHNDGVVFLLWGKPAQAKLNLINKSLHKVVMNSHPSPLSANRQPGGFIGSKCFSKCNSALKELGRAPIDWNID